MIDMLLNVFDALAGQRVGAQIRILTRRRKQILILENAEELEQALRRLSGGVEEAEPGLVGLRLLLDRILQVRALHDGRAAGDHAARALTAGRRRGGAGEHHGDDSLDRCIAQRLLGTRQMAAGDMAGLVGGDADDLIWTLAADQQPGMEEEVLSAGDEGVQSRIIHEVDADHRRVEAGHCENWRHELPNGSFDLGVANETDRLLGRCLARRRQGEDRQSTKGPAKNVGNQQARPRMSRYNWSSQPCSSMRYVPRRARAYRLRRQRRPTESRYAEDPSRRLCRRR